jgi:hypothetical protein
VGRIASIVKEARKSSIQLSFAMFIGHVAQEVNGTVLHYLKKSLSGTPNSMA